MRTTFAPSTGDPRQARMVDALCRSAALCPPGERAKLIETHISYVLIAGGFAYKIKKAVRYEFLDFSTLQARRFYCEEELRLNRRLAPALYLSVDAITGDPDAPRIGGSGEVLDFAVRMRAFPEHALLSDMLERGELRPRDIDAFARVVARFHREAAVAGEDSAHGRAGDALADALANFAALKHLDASAGERAWLARLEAWTLDAHAAARSLLDGRRRAGFVRECHGDLHLGNVALVDGSVTPFDCIEFSERMRWTDVMSDVAFAAMDLHQRGQTGLAHRFVNAYLEITGDYAGAPLLPLFEVYRALVRAKVVAMRAAQMADADDRERAARNRAACIELAHRLAHPSRGAIIVTHGLSGSGKTTTTQALVERTGAIRIRTDVERKRLAQAIPPGTTLYSDACTRATYENVLALATVLACAGTRVVVDGAFLGRWQRSLFRERAHELAVDFVLLDFVGDVDTLRERLRQRNRDGSDASDADEQVLVRQIATREPLGADERSGAVEVDACSRVAEQLATPAMARVLQALDAPALAEANFA